MFSITRTRISTLDLSGSVILSIIMKMVITISFVTVENNDYDALNKTSPDL